MEKKHMFSNRDLRKLLIPLVVEQILNSLMGTADSIMVSNVGPAAISAVSLVDSINILVIQAFYAHSILARETIKMQADPQISWFLSLRSFQQRLPRLVWHSGCLF